jgi:hypothetical protein
MGKTKINNSPLHQIFMPRSSLEKCLFQNSFSLRYFWTLSDHINLWYSCENSHFLPKFSPFYRVLHDINRKRGLDVTTYTDRDWLILKVFIQETCTIQYTFAIRFKRKFPTVANGNIRFNVYYWYNIGDIGMYFRKFMACILF